MIIFLDFTLLPNKAEDTLQLERLLRFIDEFQRKDETHRSLLGLVVSFGKFLSPILVRSFSLGCINIHPSLLPRWKGSSPLLHSLMSGDEVVGVSVLEINPKSTLFDSGYIMYQKSISLTDCVYPIYTIDHLISFLEPYSTEAMFKVAFYLNYFVFLFI